MPKGIYLHIPKLSPLERFLNLISIKDNGCWEWTNYPNGAGYGRIWINGRSVFAHRFSYEWFNNCKLPEFIPGGLQLDHLCRNRKCVNPDHLELVTGKINLNRGIQHCPINRKLENTHCPHGHPYSEENIFYHKNIINPSRPWRVCKICSKEQQRRRYQNKKLPNIKKG